MKTKSLLYTLAAVLVVPLFTAGCPDNSSNDEPLPLVTPIGNIVGDWQISESYPSCFGDTGDTYVVTAFNQSGNSITVNAPVDGGTQNFNGTISGNKLWWTGSFPDTGGTTTIHSMDLTVASDCNSLSGTTTWSWTDGFDSCNNFTSTVIGTRLSGSGC